jgi:AraC family transcriptional regulator, transcriptional activator FtrA
MVRSDPVRTVWDMHVLGLALHEDSMLYEAAIAAEVFGVDRSDLSPTGDWYEFLVCTAGGSPGRWFPTIETRDFAALAELDTVIVPSTAAPDRQPDPALLGALRNAHAAGARIAALCTGAFVLAASGLLDGRTATTHWMHADRLGCLHPSVDVRADVLYVDDGQVLTSAGKTAPLDLCLHLVHRDFGAAAANGLARRLVVPSHRMGVRHSSSLHHRIPT